MRRRAGRIVAAAVNAVLAFGLTGEDRLLAALPLFHVAGLGAVLGTLSAGGTVVLPGGATAGEAWALVRGHGVTVAVFVTGTGAALRHPDAVPGRLRLVFGMAPVVRGGRGHPAQPLREDPQG